MSMILFFMEKFAKYSCPGLLGNAREGQAFLILVVIRLDNVVYNEDVTAL